MNTTLQTVSRSSATSKLDFNRRAPLANTRTRPNSRVQSVATRLDSDQSEVRTTRAVAFSVDIFVLYGQLLLSQLITIMPRIRFDRHELSGAFGDIGTDLPLLVGLIPAAGFDSASVFIVFGLFQMLSGLVYGLPMPMQPLKAMAVLVITHKYAANVVHGAGLAIGVVMITLAVS